MRKETLPLNEIGLTRVIDNWKHDMLANGYAFSRISDYSEKIRAQATEIIETALTEAMADMLDSLGNHPEEIKFLEDLNVNIEYAKLWPLSNKTDYSVQSYDMKPHLLKNGKLSKDGKLYKVIPIGGERDYTGGVQSNLFRTMGNIQREQAGSLKMQVQRMRQRKLGTGPKAATEFRTVTSDQPKSKWVHPGIDFNFTVKLTEKNKAVEGFASDQIISIMSQYESALEEETY